MDLSLASRPQSMPHKFKTDSLLSTFTPTSLHIYLHWTPPPPLVWKLIELRWSWNVILYSLSSWYHTVGRLNSLFPIILPLPGFLSKIWCNITFGYCNITVTLAEMFFCIFTGSTDTTRISQGWHEPCNKIHFCGTNELSEGRVWLIVLNTCIAAYGAITTL